jgi:hypothetical protein
MINAPHNLRNMTKSLSLPNQKYVLTAKFP